MHIKSFLVLILFVTYLVTPVVVSLIQKNDKGFVLSIAEEEKNSNTAIEFEKNIKIAYDLVFLSLFEFKNKKASGFTYNRFASHIYLDPVSPPPKNS